MATQTIGSNVKAAAKAGVVPVCYRKTFECNLGKLKTGADFLWLWALPVGGSGSVDFLSDGLS